MSETRPLTRHEQQIIENVAEFGCHITCVSATIEDDDFDDFDEDDLDEDLEDDLGDGRGAEGLHGGDEGARPDERFAYSVGFPHTVGQPDVIVFGFSTNLSAAVINGLLDQCREGLVMEDWTEVTGLLEGHRCVLREVEPDCIVPYYFNSAIWFSRHETGADPARAMQVVWPGADDGKFPWDKDCAPAVRDLQTPLYRTSLNS